MWQNLSRAVSGGGSECGNRISDYNFTDYLSRAVSGGGSECGKISRVQCLKEGLNVATESAITTSQTIS